MLEPEFRILGLPFSSTLKGQSGLGAQSWVFKALPASEGPGRVELYVPSLQTRLLNGIYTQEDATRAPHFRVLKEAAAYTLDAKNIGSPSARTSESVVDVVTEQGWLVLLRPPPCRRWPPYILSLRIRVARETLRRIGTPNAHILRFLNTTSRTSKPCQRGPPAALPIPDNTYADTELSLSSTRGNDKHATPFAIHRAVTACILNGEFSSLLLLGQELTYHRSVNNTEWDGNGAAATDADACVAASADADACAPHLHHHPANNRPATPGMPSSSSSYASALEESYTAASNTHGSAGNSTIDNNRRAYDDFGFSSPLGDDESDETTSGGGGGGSHYTTLLATYPAVVPAGGALTSAASQGGMDALEELRLLKDQVRDVSRVCNAVATGDLTQKITVRM
ncbi:hypothetical protein B0H11DRAFT_2257302 [Mycena galericulata]|nr:hypothetical protein B0H11DRAFT_2257302 [Mycena galericulata]